MTIAAPRLAFIDALKAIASQLIVLHHLAFYGPMSDYAQELAPALISWLSQEARIAVQAFLVIGGFLAAKSLAPSGILPASTAPLALVRSRYWKLVIPYTAALLLSIVCATMARTLMSHDSIPGAPAIPQFIAHLLLLQNALGFDALSAGVWYVAIDFQLFVALVAMLWLARGIGNDANTTRVAGILLISALALGSLFYFNRSAAWDDWALYFFGAYALGALTYWAATRKFATEWLLLIAAAVLLALLVDYRSRVAVALTVAVSLGMAQRYDLLMRWPQWRASAYLGKISYSVFLMNFPVCLVINALFSRFASSDPVINAIGVLLAWAASVGAGALFYRFVESRSRHLQESLRNLTTAPIMRLPDPWRFALRLKPKS